MRALRILLATTTLSLPAAPALACPEDGGDHRFFAFAALMQDQRRAPEPSQGGEPPASQQDSGSSGQGRPQPDQSSDPGSSPSNAADAVTFR